MGNNGKDEKTIEATLLTMPPDEPAHIADLALMLHSQTDFKITIVGCNPRSFFSLRFRDPIAGLSMPGFTAEQFIKYGRGKVQTHCRVIGEILGDVMSKNDRLQINYISGRPRKIANTLESMFDLIIIPRSYQLPNIGQRVFGEIGLQLVRAKRIPVLFCSAPEKWQHIVIMEADNDKDYGEPCTMNYLVKFLGNTILKEKPKDVPTMSIHSDNLTEQSSVLASFGILDASKMQPQQQADTILVVSTKIACSFFRYSKLKEILRNWAGSILVFPP